MSVQIMNVYHDESYSHDKKWFFTGLLWVNQKNKDIILKKLISPREKNNWWYDLSFKDLTDHSPKRKTVIEWLSLYFKELFNLSSFYCLAVDRQHPKYDYQKFSEKFHEYNRFTAMALYSSYKWFFKNSQEKLEIDMISHNKKRRPPEFRFGNGKNLDNFETYIPKKFSLQIEEGQRKNKTIDGHSGNYLPAEIKNVKPISIRDERNIDTISSDEEILQLCDILLGSVNQAITKSSIKPIKKQLGNRVEDSILDIEKLPWEQNQGLYKKFSVCCFPNEKGEMYYPNISSIYTNKNNLKIDSPQLHCKRLI